MTIRFPRASDKAVPFNALKKIRWAIVLIDFPFDFGPQLPIVSSLLGDNRIRDVAG